MAIMVWITVKVKDGNCDQVLKLLDSPEGNDFTASQRGCEQLNRSIDHENPNHILLTELWSSKEDWDVYFEMQQEVRDNNGFNKQLLPLLEEDGIKITFSEVNKSKRSNVPDHIQRILDEDEKEKHFLVVHSWISDEAKREILTPPEERDPPQKRKTEREWAQENASREDASVVQHWITTEDFFYCHWIARNEQDIYKTLEKWGVEGTKINSMASEAYEYVTAFRSSETVFKKF